MTWYLAVIAWLVIGCLARAVIVRLPRKGPFDGMEGFEGMGGGDDVAAVAFAIAFGPAFIALALVLIPLYLLAQLLRRMDP